MCTWMLTPAVTFSCTGPVKPESEVTVTVKLPPTPRGAATLNGSVTPNGALTMVSFQWGTNATYGSSTALISAGNGTSAVHMSNELFGEYGIWVSAVLYPAVPIGTSILRAIPTAAHSKEDLQALVKALCEMKEYAHAEPSVAAPRAS